MEKVKGAVMQKMEKVKGAVMQKMEKVKGAVMQKMEADIGSKETPQKRARATCLYIYISYYIILYYILLYYIIYIYMSGFKFAGQKRHVEFLASRRTACRTFSVSMRSASASSCGHRSLW
jgi:hypothetical protein